VRWLRENLFSSWANALGTLVLAVLLLRWIPPFLDWALVKAVWLPSQAAACREGAVACWAFIAEKHRFILYGTYPFEQQWRPAAASLVIIALWTLSLWRRAWRPALALAWLAGLAAVAALLWGGIAGLPYVENERWGGLVLTLLLSTFGIAGAFPLAVLLALGRQSRLPVLRTACVGYIELIRGVPLISVLFMASVMLPLFLPAGAAIDKLLRAQIALVLFAAAYLAEVVRGGLQSVPRGQHDAADALGLKTHQKYLFVVLPQALRLAEVP